MAISIGKKIAGAALASTLALGAGAAAWAADGSNTPASSTSAAAVNGALGAKAGGAKAGGAKAGGAKASGLKVKGGLGILRRADHGDVEIAVKGAKGAAPTWETVTFDRGKVSDVAADHITLARPDGQSVTLKIDGSTKYHGVTSWQEVQKDKPAVVISKGGTATQILQAKATAAPATPAAA